MNTMKNVKMMIFMIRYYAESVFRESMPPFSDKNPLFQGSKNKFDKKMLSRFQKCLYSAILLGSDSFDHAESKSGFRFFLKLS